MSIVITSSLSPTCKPKLTCSIMHVRPSDVLPSLKFSLDITRVTFFLGIRNGNPRKLRLRNEKENLLENRFDTRSLPSVPSLSSDSPLSPSLWLIYLLFCCCFTSSPSSIPIRIFSNTHVAFFSLLTLSLIHILYLYRSTVYHFIIQTFLILKCCNHLTFLIPASLQFATFP